MKKKQLLKKQLKELKKTRRLLERLLYDEFNVNINYDDSHKKEY